jgi:GAF domain-containing protein/HAMP domain-containing protein
MTGLFKPYNDIREADEKLAQSFYAGSRFNSVFLAMTAMGFIVIYLFTQNQLLGEPAPQLLFIAGALFVLAVLQIPTSYLARTRRGIAANFLGTASMIIFLTLLTAFWQGVTPIAIVISFITPATAVTAGLPRRYYPWMAVALLAGVSAILYANANPPIERLATNSAAAIAGMAFLVTIGTLLLTVTVVARSRRYRNLRTQLLTSFITVVTIPTLLATVLSALGAYVNNERQTLNVLETISRLKENQINEIIDGFRVNATRISQDPEFQSNAINVLNPGQSDESSIGLARSIARLYLIDFQATERELYTEIMVLNIQGAVVISTSVPNEGTSYQAEEFYRSGSLEEFVGFSDNPTFGGSDLIYATPVYSTDGTAVRGVLVFRTNSQIIKDIMEVTPSFAEMESYIVAQDATPLTKTRFVTPKVFSLATESMFPINKIGVNEGNGVYTTYSGAVVLGFYKRFDRLDNTAMIAEVPRDYVLESSIRSLISTSALAAFAILIAIAAIVVSAESIANPITVLAETAERFANGQLSARAAIDRRDEIGALNRSYNQMAEQLQDIIGKLEQRVADRTRELEEQSLRLRTSAEIARDAATSHNLNDLLDKAGTLIQQRFGFYHTGIFLIDANREYAVLSASPTDAGKQMIANNHRLRIGEVGIVGRVAATGDPRITLDTGADVVFFNNPYLPKTRSEMALALKVENRIIGVLDVQSDQPQAFDDNDIAIIQILADQLATAIERARLLEQVEQNLRDIEQAYGRFTRESWRTLGESGLLSKSGYRFDNIRIQPITEAPELGEEVMAKGVPVTSTDNKDGGKRQIAIPIKLRGQTIGVVSVNLKEGYTQSTISTLQLAIERLALSLESARLYEEARLRADREQTIAQVTSSISSAIDFDTILRTTVEEVGKSIGDAEISIQIVSDQN